MSAKTDNAILSCAFVTIGSTVASDIMPVKYGGQAKGFDFRHIIGGTAAFTLLLMLGQFADNLAMAFAIMVATIAFLYNGAPLLEAFTYAK